MNCSQFIVSRSILFKSLEKLKILKIDFEINVFHSYLEKKNIATIQYSI